MIRTNTEKGLVRDVDPCIVRHQAFRDLMVVMCGVCIHNYGNALHRLGAELAVTLGCQVNTQLCRSLSLSWHRTLYSHPHRMTNAAGRMALLILRIKFHRGTRWSHH